MAIRTNAAAVEGIIETQVIIPLTPFIEVASMLVDRVEVITAGDDVPYTAAELELIERWLSAHFYGIRDNRKDTEKAGSVSEKNQYKVGLNMNVTIYGQQVLLIDYKGTLAVINKQAADGKRTSVSLLWAGTDPDTV